MIRPPPPSTPLYSSAASDVYKRQVYDCHNEVSCHQTHPRYGNVALRALSLIHISEPTRLRRISYAVFCLKKKKKEKKKKKKKIKKKKKNIKKKKEKKKKNKQ